MDYEVGNMFTVMPMSQRFYLEPGQTYEGSVSVVNPADAKEDFRYRASVTPYAVLGEEYEADLTTKSNQSAIVDWITIDEPTGSVEPNGVKEIKFTITVPENAAGGGQYATIAIGSDTVDSGGEGVSVKNVFEMASIIYANVAGDVNHEGVIAENKVPGFVTMPPVTVETALENHGNVHEDATIIIKATNFFTGEVILPTEENEGKYREVIMPDTERYVTREVEGLPLVGVVHIEQTVYYLGTSSTEAKNVIICPLWFMLLIAVTIGAIIAVVVRMIVKHHRKKQLI